MGFSLPNCILSWNQMWLYSLWFPEEVHVPPVSRKTWVLANTAYDSDLCWEKSFNRESNFPVICNPELEFPSLLLQYLNMAAFKIKRLHKHQSTIMIVLKNSMWQFVAWGISATKEIIQYIHSGCSWIPFISTKLS